MNYDIQSLPKNQWPALLHEIPDAPKQLFYAGNLPVEQNNILTVVGSRKYSSYGKEVCEHLIHGLAGYPITIVSGLALGIDSIAHTSAIRAGLQTIAVPGSGLSKTALYPASHLHLAEDIITHGGGLLSEFEPNFKATKWSFPQRNRIMAGMSHAVLVVEAEEKSGTLITSRLATEYNRDVFTIPGSIFASQSAGPHMLIRLGATPITSADDILDAFDMAHASTETAPLDMSAYTEHEQKIITLIQSGISDKEILFEKVDLDTATVQITLMSLEIKGVVKESSGNIIITMS